MPLPKTSIPTFLLTHKIEIPVVRKIGEWVKGRWVESEIPEEFSIEGNVQPVKMNEILQMPEADRTREWIKVYTAESVVTAEEGTDPNLADVLIYHDKRYKAMKQKQYDMGVLDHFCVYCAKEPVTAGY